LETFGVIGGNKGGLRQVWGGGFGFKPQEGFNFKENFFQHFGFESKGTRVLLKTRV